MSSLCPMCRRAPSLEYKPCDSPLLTKDYNVKHEFLITCKCGTKRYIRTLYEPIMEEWHNDMNASQEQLNK